LSFLLRNLLTTSAAIKANVEVARTVIKANVEYMRSTSPAGWVSSRPLFFTSQFNAVDGNTGVTSVAGFQWNNANSTIENLHDREALKVVW
jgi:hypothetical protein